jgi:GTP cyclohydrolase I
MAITPTEKLIRKIISRIGDDPKRDGLLETPGRVVRSWGELYAGYNQNPKDVLKTFDADGYNELVLLKNIEMYSMCEHHMIPFFGQAHIAYIPDKRIIGISKLARLLEIYARRLQNQERITVQVTKALMKIVKPVGAACIIEAKHLCSCARGINKQNSILVTSSLRGSFRKDPKARPELMSLIRG